MSSTYDLMRGAARVQMEIDENSGLISEDTAAFLVGWIEESEDKVLACMHLVRRMEVEAELLEAEEKRLRFKRKTCENVTEHVKALATGLLLAREAMGEESKVKGPTYSAWLAETVSIVGPDEVSEWPEHWRRVKVEPDRAAALRAAKGGAALPEGFELKATRGVRWR
jgi:2-keto-4-pentenoate hydratase